MSQGTSKIRQQSDIHSDNVSNASTDSGDAYDFKPLCLRQTNNIRNFKAKRSLCRNFIEKGYCPYGSKCQFAHGTNELKCNSDDSMSYKTRPCHAFARKDFCVYGDRCNFVHESQNEPEKEVQLVLNQYRELVYSGRSSSSSRLISMMSLK